jgi:hypothetical protein
VDALAAENTRTGKSAEWAAAVAQHRRHSYGGGGALLAANSNSNAKITSAFGVSPVPNGQLTYPDITLPTLILGGQNVPYTPNFPAQYASIRSTTTKVLAEFATSTEFESMHAIGRAPLGTHRTDPVVARYGLSFLKVNLAGDTRYRQFLVNDPSLYIFKSNP